MMVDIIPKEAPQLPFWLKKTFYSLLAFFIFSLIGLLFLNIFVNNIKAEISELETVLNSEELEKVSPLEREALEKKMGKIKEFSLLLENHLESSRIFPFIQDISHPRVWFSELKFNAMEGRADLSGEAQDFGSLGQQIYIFKETESVLSFELNSLSANEKGRVNFRLSLTLDPDKFKANYNEED